jgi:hypothetical protein
MLVVLCCMLTRLQQHYHSSSIPWPIIERGCAALCYLLRLRFTHAIWHEVMTIAIEHVLLLGVLRCCCSLLMGQQTPQNSNGAKPCMMTSFDIPV